MEGGVVLAALERMSSVASAPYLVWRDAVVEGPCSLVVVLETEAETESVVQSIVVFPLLSLLLMTYWRQATHNGCKSLVAAAYGHLGSA